jgi:hypothetical protein
VTIADRAAESVITAAIANAYPDHGIRGEEHGRRAGASRYTWVDRPDRRHAQLHTRADALGDADRALTTASASSSASLIQPYVGESVCCGGRRAGGVAPRQRSADACHAPLRVRH